MKVSDIQTISFDGRYLPKCTARQEILLLSILFDPKASKDRRLFLVGRLHSFGYCEKKIMWVIDKYNRWEGYNRDITERWVSYQFRILGTDYAPNFFKPVPKLLPKEAINKFLAETRPWTVSPPSGLKSAAIYYHRLGGHVIPMRKKEKLPVVPWKAYQEIQPDDSDIMRWDFSNGIILIATDNHTFLDIDVKSDKHPDGIENFDDSVLKGRHYERTKNGGYHVFGLGKIESVKTKGVEIIGKGRYIVTYPTPGYAPNQKI